MDTECRKRKRFNFKLPRIRKIRMRITLYFSVLVFFIIAAISFVISFIFSQQIIEQTSSVVQQKATIITRDIEEKLNVVKNISSDLRKDEKLQELMAMQATTKEEYSNKSQLISSLLSSRYSNGNNTIHKIIAIDNDGRIFDPLYSLSLYRGAITPGDSYNRFIRSSLYSKFSEPFTFPTDQKANMTISYYCQYLDNNTYQQIGYMLINIKRESLFADIKMFCNEVFDAACIMNKEGKAVYLFGNESLSDMILKADTQGSGNHTYSINFEENSYLVFREDVKNYSDWHMVGVVSKTKLEEKVWLMNAIIYAIGFICLLVVIFIGFYISKRITGPILEVNHAMNQFEKGEWPDRVEPVAEDELKTLAKGFNKMVWNIKNLIEDICKEQEEKKKAEITALQFQLESLQHQINPHFMHNTLNAIAYLALKRGADDIREMIQSFNMLLRASMSAGNEFIPVDEEVACIRHYLKIQECRYGDVFRFYCNVPEGICGCRIPRLILQPLVENALFHGIAPKNTQGTIGVEFLEEEDDTIRVRVLDDGVGIRKELVSYVLAKDSKRNKSRYTNIGLANIDERLRLYFGNRYRLQIFSRIGIGTCVEFLLPRMDVDDMRRSGDGI